MENGQTHDFELVLQKSGGKDVCFPVTSEGLTVGRASSCDIVLTDKMVSRQHARVWTEDNSVFVEDLGSRNGVVVNHRRVWRGCLLDGDEVVIGEQVFSLNRIRPIGQPATEGTAITFEEADGLVENLVKSAGAKRLLVLYDAARLLASVFNLDDLLERTLELVTNALSVRRGFILTRYNDSAEFEVRAHTRQNEASPGPPISDRIVQQVFSARSSVLTYNALEDPRFSDAQSVIQYGIHAAMCVPLPGRSRIVGVIYVDAGIQDETFGDDELRLLTAIGRIVGVGVENALLHQDILRNERLAAIGQATAGIGHCVKNILAGAKGGSEFIDMAIADAEWKYAEKGSSLIKNSLNRIEDLVLNLLTFSRDVELSPTKTDLNLLVRQAISVVESRAEKIGALIQFVQGDLDTILVDAQQIFRVILNLVTNAIEALEDTGGKITVLTRMDLEGCYIEVKDTGQGIPPELKPRIFDAFVTSKGARGTGLGLACSLKIVSTHNGAISVESEPGRGAAFTVFLPFGGVFSPPGEREKTQPPA